jgi:hypothetical protein
MKRARLILGCLLVLAAAAPAAAIGAPRIPVGFQDDPSFRWRDDRITNFNNAATTGATIIRTTAYWSRIAPTRPVNATDPFDPANNYQFDDIDELVRSAAFRGMTVLLTIWGTPGWANGNQGENHAPTRMSDLQDFAHALAARYSGRYPGFPFVGYYSIWNEPNLEEFLAPTYDKSGKPASPAIYAKIASAAYAGIKAGNRRAAVAVGETSPRGRLRPTSASGVQNTIAPGLFAQLVAKAAPKLKFDAWAHHPYSGLGQGPNVKVAFPNVNLPQIPTFEKKLQQWFKRKYVSIWVTEYGFETKPGEPKGVTYAQQAAYAKQVLNQVGQSPYIGMFIWFIFRDDPTSTWQSGLENEDNTHKPAFATFTKGARALDVRDPVQHIKPGSSNPMLRIPVWEFEARDGVGAKLGATVSVTYRGRSVAAQPTSIIGIDGYASFRIPIVNAKKNGLYVVYLKIGDDNGNSINRVAEILSGL